MADAKLANRLNNLPLERMAIGFDALLDDECVLSVIERNLPYGIIVFERNFRNLNHLKACIATIKNLKHDIEFFIDQEGGEKCRIYESPFCPPPPNKLALRGLSLVRNAYRLSSEALAELGITVNLAPVADIGLSSYISERCFGANPEIVSECVVAAIEGVHAGGLKACAKHFPGLGCAKGDPHNELLYSDESINTFRNIHFAPFVAAIGAGVDFIMTTHIVAKCFDKHSPATYSKKIVGLLRDELAFDGKIITDDLSYMKGALDYSLPKKVSLSISAGHDFALACRI